MKADSIRIAKVFSGGGDIHYILPHFQREYSWTQQQWETLLSDAWAIYEEYDVEGEYPEHFLGSLVVINDGTCKGAMTAFKLVDGQQRLTTISLLFCVLRDILDGSHPQLARKCHKFLVNVDEGDNSDFYFKLLPTMKYGDRLAYTSIIKKQIPADVESNIPQAYKYFYEQIQQKINTGIIDPEKLYEVIINCFQVVHIDLNKDESPYKIFESLNAKGKDLSQADLTRNYIAMRLPIKEQEKVFNQSWSKIEALLQEKRTVGRSRIGELTAFLRHYLARTSKNLCAENHIYARWRDRCEKDFREDRAFIEELERLRSFAEYYDKLLRPQNESQPKLQAALNRLNTLDLQTAYPFLLEVYYNYSQEKINQQDFLEILHILENYLVRRYIAGESTNYLNKMFASLYRDILGEQEETQQDFINTMKKVLCNKQYPSDKEVERAILTRKIYGTSNHHKIYFVLETINRHLSQGAGGYTTLDSSPTVEHILPQKPNQQWKEDLGINFDKICHEYLNNLGNLTLVTSEWNSSLSNSDFWQKRQKLSGHALKINNDYFSQDIPLWNEAAILERANFISQKFLEIWPSLGEVSPPSRKYHKSPASVTIKGETREIKDKTWRQFMITVVEWGLNNIPESFVVAKSNLPTYFCDHPSEDKNPSKSWHLLSNGVYVSQSYSAKDHLKFCRRFLSYLGVEESDWTWEEE